MWLSLFRVGTSDNEEVWIKSEEGLNKALDKLKEREGAAELFVNADTPHLFIAVTNGLATLSLDPKSDTVPYRRLRWIGTASDELVIFNVGNTATEVEQRYCIPVEYLKTIVDHFYRTKEILDSDQWTWEVDPG